MSYVLSARYSQHYFTRVSYSTDLDLGLVQTQADDMPYSKVDTTLGNKKGSLLNYSI
jgi:hypothetical protein